MSAFSAGSVTLKLDSLEEAFAAMQWIALMAGVKLNEVVVQVDPFTDAAWRVRAAELQAKRDEQSRVLREIDLARRQYAEAQGRQDDEIPPATW